MPNPKEWSYLKCPLKGVGATAVCPLAPLCTPFPGEPHLVLEIQKDMEAEAGVGQKGQSSGSCPRATALKGPKRIL